MLQEKENLPEAEFKQEVSLWYNQAGSQVLTLYVSGAGNIEDSFLTQSGV